MDADWVRRFCLSLPHTTEGSPFGPDDLVFKIGGKMYAVVVLVPAPVCLSFKCTPEEFADLVERPGVIPAPYSARYHWVALEHEDALPAAEIKQRLRRSYDLVFARLPGKAQSALGAPSGKRRPARG
jgi:predicted DNA-binding protein (MmcQ/YjbR family)